MAKSGKPRRDEIVPTCGRTICGQQNNYRPTCCQSILLKENHVMSDPTCGQKNCIVSNRLF